MAQAAYYRLETKNVKRSEGHSSVAAAAYNTAEKLYDERTGITHDYRNKQHVYGNEILAPANAPAWVFDRHQLWNECERVEDGSTRSKDARPARQLILSFPAFLSHDEKIKVSRSFLQKECVAKGMVADVAWHDFTGEHEHNPHAHVLLTTRLLDGDRFGKKNRAWNSKQQLQEWREKWAEYLNRHLEQKGYQERVDHRSYQAQGIDRIPGKHEGRNITAFRNQYETKVETPTIIYNDKVAEINALKQQIQIELAELAHEEELERKKAAEQDNRKPTLQQMQSTAKLATELRQQARVDYAQVTKEVIQGVAEHVDSSMVIQAKPADVTKEKNRESSKPASVDKQQAELGQRKARTDRTYRAVMRQLEAMGGDGRFEIGIGNDERGYFKEKTWHKHDILRIDPQTGKAAIVDYLKGENARGSHIYVRLAPHDNGDSQGLILIDDLDPVMTEDLKDKGLQPSVVVQTSFKNCQAWVKMTDRLGKEETTQLAKLLAQEAGGDPGSASYQHYGRLAGFTNRKEKHFDVYSGKYPWVTVEYARQQQATRAGHFLTLAREAAVKEAAEKAEAVQQRAALLKDKVTAAELHQAAKIFKTISTSVERKYGIKDGSRRDWAVLKRMAKRGYSLEALEYALSHSADLESRKKGHAEDYIRRTIDKISHDPDVLATLKRRKDRSEGRTAPETKQPSPPVSPTLPNNRDRQTERHYYKDPHRSRPASAASYAGAVKQLAEKAASSSSAGSGQQQRRDHFKTTSSSPGAASQERKPGGSAETIRLKNYDVTAITLHPVGNMDTNAVQYVITRILQSTDAEKQFNKGLWALTQETGNWRNQCNAEYLKELGRIVKTRRVQALHPHTDAEIAIKLRMAGFSKVEIGKTLSRHSPFVRALPDEQSRHQYLADGIASEVNHPRIYQKIAAFHQQRVQQAQELTEAQRGEFLKEHRFDKLGIATTGQETSHKSSSRPSHSHTQQKRHDQNHERER